MVYYYDFVDCLFAITRHIYYFRIKVINSQKQNNNSNINKTTFAIVYIVII